MHRLNKLIVCTILGVALSASALPVSADDPVDVAQLEKQRCPKPTEFAIVFSFGYAADKMPKDDGKFEDLLKKIKEAGFNTIHCPYTEGRLARCKKQGIKMMVDLLMEDHHVFRNPKGAQELCEKLRKDPDVWGYNIWNDNVAKTGEGRRRDVNNVRQWDPTHPAFSGTYRTSGMNHLANADLIGYYDFHWKRGIPMHFPHLLAFSNWARERDAWFYTWLSATSGLPGKGNFNRSLYSANTGIACGLKGILWFLATDLMKGENQEWTVLGKDITKVNLEILPLSKELARLPNPSAIYSTPITKNPNNQPLPDDMKDVMPTGLDKNVFPKDSWIQPAGGEFVVGIFKDGAKHEALFVANHNAYAEQKVAMKLNDAVKVQLFNRRQAKWQPLEINEEVVRFQLEAGGGELLRVER